MNDLRKNFFCYICKCFAEHILMDNKWHCCCCNPLLLEELIDEYYPIIEK